MSPAPHSFPAPSVAARPPVSLASPARWLALGWSDLRQNPLPGLLHGFLLTGFGALLLWAAGEKFWLLAGAFSGFLIVAPILATGLYQVSRALESGRRVGMAEVASLWRSGDLVTWSVPTKEPSSVVALPMLVDTPASVMEAVKASWRAVANHPGAMVAWAVLIVLLVGLGMASALLGLIVIVPLIAHASWHAYRDLTSPPAHGASTR